MPRKLEAQRFPTEPVTLCPAAARRFGRVERGRVRVAVLQSISVVLSVAKEYGFACDW